MKNYTKENICGLKAEDFHGEIDGKNTELFVLKNKNGMELCVCNYGATVMAIMAPDKNGKFENVVLGHDNLERLINNPEPYLGTTIGRYGNRIADGKFTLEGKEYQLAINNGHNNLHGGKKGFNAVVWDAEQINESTLRLHYLSVDGEEGFQGNLDVTMTYRLNDENMFIIDYHATTDKTTIVNLTNHAFFNLAGITNPSPSIENNILTINADYYTPINENCIPFGDIAPVKGTPFDFTTPHTIGERINADDVQIKNGAGYDHNFVLNKEKAGEITLAATCTEPVSGRTLKVHTTEPGMQLYSGNWLNGFEGMFGSTFPARSAVCFETQHYPDSPNKPQFQSVELKPGETYSETCNYEFIAGEEK